MTRLFLLFLATCFLAGTFNSCNKETIQSENSSAEVSDESVIRLLSNFTDAYSSFQNGKLLKSGQKIDLDSVIWYIDGAINYNYASGEFSFGKFHKDTVYVEVALDPNMKAMIEDVLKLYGESLQLIGSKYYAISGENRKFVMATVSDAGTLPNGKRKLKIATLTGTGFPVSGNFGPDENYKYNRGALYNCDGIPSSGAPEVFELMLSDHFNTTPPTGCRVFYYGTESALEIHYESHRLNTTLTNYLDYKIFAASDNVLPITNVTECLEYDQDGSGIHEMQFYLDYLIDFVNQWLDQPGNSGTNRKWFAGSNIISKSEVNDFNEKGIWHVPTLLLKKRGYSCEQVDPIELPTN